MTDNTDSTERVYSAVLDIFKESGRPAECKKIFERAGVTPVMGTDRLRALTDGRRLNRQGRGTYLPSQIFREDESVSVTSLPGGMVKIEKGDAVSDWTPGEIKALGRMVGGFAA